MQKKTNNRLSLSRPDPATGLSFNVYALLISFILSVFGNAASAQANYEDVNQLAARMVSRLRANTGEVVFIHTDKSIYRAGETIWFNAYLLNKVSHRLSHQSRALFVDLVSASDSVVARLILDPMSLRSGGGIELSSLLPDGNYWLRGFTNNILKTDSADICVHPLYVVNPDRPGNPLKRRAATNNAGGPAKVTMTPEGGALIAGTDMNVAFHITDAQNLPIDAEGWVTDNRDTILTRFTTSFPGYGNFQFTPWRTRTYTAWIRTPEGTVKYPLGITSDTSATLSVVGGTPSSIKVRVSLGDSLYGKKINTYILGLSRDSICYAGIGHGMYEVDIPRSVFPSGEAVLLLFDQQENLMSERDIYISDTTAFIHARPDQAIYQPRQKFHLDIDVTDKQGKPLSAMMSVSVTDSSVDYFDDGAFERITQGDIASRERDLRMLAHQNVYEAWMHADTIALKKRRQAEDSIFDLRGTVFNGKDEVIPHAVITMVTSDPFREFLVDTADATGNFRFHYSTNGDSTSFVLQASNQRGALRDAKFVLHEVPFPHFATPRYLVRYVSPESTAEIKNTRFVKPDFLLPDKFIELQEVRVKSKAKPIAFDRQRLSQFSKVLSGEIISRTNIGVGNSVLMIPGVQLRRGRLLLAGGEEEPLLVMNGAEYDSTTLGSESIDRSSPILAFLNRLSPSEIDYIEVLEGPEAATYGVRGGHGVIAIHTLSQPRETNFVQTAARKFVVRGFSSTPVFVSPDYSKRSSKSVSQDLRSTVYWNAPVFTDQAGKASIEFYTSDKPGHYTITIQGITATGELIFRRLQVQ